MPSAKAADLGGDCCADLEERVAELEATTARKGNRKVSLSVYGWVHKGILYWNDGNDSNTYLGVDNTNYATRFGFQGNARINPNVTAGFGILMDVITGATTSSVNQRREDVALSVVDGATTVGGITAWNDDPIIRMRQAEVWVEHKSLGRMTVGHLGSSTGFQGIIDLAGNVGIASNAAISLVGGGFVFRNSATGDFSGATITNNTSNGADWSHRIDGLRWDSPSLGGFVIGLSAGEAASVQDRGTAFDTKTATGPQGLYWAANLRYAGEFSGFRVAAAASYEESQADELLSSSTVSAGTSLADSTNVGFSASILHMASGLFLQGSHITVERPNTDGTTDSGTLWHIQAGISQNWTGLGKTSIYGEYAQGADLQRAYSSATAVTLGNDYTMWGFGVVQTIDAAALDIYVAFRNHSLSADAAGLTAAAALSGLGVVQGAQVAGESVDDIQTIMGGMRIAF
jgi:hypothetical protein